jgi:hypothetical protein
MLKDIGIYKDFEYDNNFFINIKEIWAKNGD